MLKVVKISEIESVIGAEVGVSDWIVIDQERIDKFADATMDHQFIHVDEEMAKSTPWGSTIAHGFLTLSMVTYLSVDNTVMPENIQMAINYGLDKVRFMEAVPVNSKIRGRFVLSDVQYKKAGRWLVKHTATIEIEGKDKPAAIAEPLTLFVVTE
jgi:acyl dehydratase